MPLREEGFIKVEEWAQPYRQHDDGTAQGNRAVYLPQLDAVTFIDNGAVIVGVPPPYRFLHNRSRARAKWRHTRSTESRRVASIVLPDYYQGSITV